MAVSRRKGPKWRRFGRKLETVGGPGHEVADLGRQAWRHHSQGLLYRLVADGWAPVEEAHQGEGGQEDHERNVRIGRDRCDWDGQLADVVG